MLGLILLALAPIQFEVVVSEFATAVYHVACLTGRVACTNSVYSSAWNGELRATAADGKEFDAFKAIFDRVEAAAPQPAPMPLLPNYGGHFPSLAVRHRILAYAFESRSGKDFERRISSLVTSADAARLRQVIEHTQARLHPWWEQTGKSEAQDQARQIKRHLRDPQLAELLRSLPSLLEAELPDRKFYLHAFPSPMAGVQNNMASYVRNHIPVELGPRMTGRDATWIALHEVTHATFDVAPSARHRHLQTELQSVPALYAYLNEALATGMQLLLYKRLGLEDTDPYNHPYIPRLGRAAMPLLDTWIKGRRSIFDGFARSYLQAASAEMKEDGRRPAFLLSYAAVLTEHAAARQAFFDTFHPIAYVTTEAERQMFPFLPTVRLVTDDELAKAPKREREVVVSAATAAELPDAIKRLAEALTLP